MGSPAERREPLLPRVEGDSGLSSSAAAERRSYAPSENYAGASPPERRAHAGPGESVTFSALARPQREVTTTLEAEAIFDLGRSVRVGRRVRRTIREPGADRPLEPADQQRLDLQGLRHGFDLLRLGAGGIGVLPVSWRTASSSRGRFALLCTEMQFERSPGSLLIELTGGLDQARPESVAAALTHLVGAGQRVVLNLGPDADAIRRLSGLQAACVAIDVSSVPQSHSQDWRQAAALIGAARGVSRQVMLLNLRADRALEAHAAGATHAVFAEPEALPV